MSDVPVSIPASSPVVQSPNPPAAPAAPHQNFFQSGIHAFGHVMSWLIKNDTVVLSQVIKYAPKAELVAELVFPEYAVLERGAKDGVVAAANLILGSVLTIQQKYSAAVPGVATNEAKAADALTLSGPGAIALLEKAGLTDTSASRIQSIIDALVAILKTQPAPAAA